jgi:purine-binding chemotaxis protein CheW
MEETEQLLATFRIGESSYGLDAMRVQEVIMVGRQTPVHGAPDYVRGVVNLRGKILTVIDLGVRLGLDAARDSEANRILVAPWKDERIGLLVEEMADVIGLDPQAVGPLPPHVPERQTRFFTGVYQDRGRLVTLLNPEAVLSARGVV